MYSAIVMLPAVIVYWIEVEATPLTVVGPVLLILLISLLVLILSCVLGWCVAKISLKLKNKSFITVILSLCFFALYYFVYFKAQDLIQNLLMNAAVYGEKVKGSAYPFYLFGKIGEGDLLAMLLYTAVIAVLCALTFVVLSRSFIKIATSSGSVKKVVYKEKKEKRKTRGAAYATPLAFIKFFNYSPATIAPVGHSPSHVPQSRHASASITYLPSPSLIASAGQASAHVPQATHSSVITYAMIKPPYFYEICFQQDSALRIFIPF